MTGLTRRGFLGASALAAAGLAAGCGGPERDERLRRLVAAARRPESRGLVGPLQLVPEACTTTGRAKQSSALGTNVVHTYYDASKAQQAFQLAKQANKMPDVYSNVIGLPLAALVSGKWVHELTLPEETLAKIPQNTLTEGITSLDKKLYGFPLFSFRQSSTLLWVNKDHYTKAGLDPDNPPTDYAGFKDACQQVGRRPGYSR